MLLVPDTETDRIRGLEEDSANTGDSLDAYLLGVDECRRATYRGLTLQVTAAPLNLTLCEADTSVRPASESFPGFWAIESAMVPRS